MPKDSDEHTAIESVRFDNAGVAFTVEPSGAISITQSVGRVSISTLLTPADLPDLKTLVSEADRRHELAKKFQPKIPGDSDL